MQALTTPDLTLPTIHLNGTGRDMLEDGYYNAYLKLQEAIRAFGSIEFNARDYYVSPDPAAFYKARTERDIARAQLAGVATYLETHLAHITP